VALVLVPTQELCTQLLLDAEEHLTLDGGVAMISKQSESPWWQVEQASLIIAQPEELLRFLDEQDAEDDKRVMERIEVFVIDEVDEHIRLMNSERKPFARYMKPGMWPAEAMIKRVIRSNDRKTLQFIAVSATAFAAIRERVHYALLKDQLDRFQELPLLNPAQPSANFLEAAAQRARQNQADLPYENLDAVGPPTDAPRRLVYSALPKGISHFTWRVPASGSHAAVAALALEKLRPASAIIFVCPNAKEAIREVVLDLGTAGWENVESMQETLSAAKFKRGDKQGWESTHKLRRFREESRKGFSDGFYRQAPILVAQENSVRGLSIDGVEAVLVLGQPKSPASYMHMAGRTGRLPHPVGSSVLLGRIEELDKVVNNFAPVTGIRSWEKLGSGCAQLQDIARLPQDWTAVPGISSQREEKMRRSFEARRLDAAMGMPVRRLGRRRPDPENAEVR